MRAGPDGKRRWAANGRLALALLLSSLLLSLAGGASAGVPKTAPQALTMLERDLGAAMAHAARLRERLAEEVGDSPAAVVVGLADGGRGSSLAGLRLAARALERRIDELRAATGTTDDPGRLELMLAMRAALGRLGNAIDDMVVLGGIDADVGPARQVVYARIELALLAMSHTVTAMGRTYGGAL